MQKEKAAEETMQIPQVQEAILKAEAENAEYKAYQERIRQDEAKAEARRQRNLELIKLIGEEGRKEPENEQESSYIYQQGQGKGRGRVVISNKRIRNKEAKLRERELDAALQQSTIERAATIRNAIIGSNGKSIEALMVPQNQQVQPIGQVYVPMPIQHRKTRGAKKAQPGPQMSVQAPQTAPQQVVIQAAPVQGLSPAQPNPTGANVPLQIAATYIPEANPTERLQFVGGAPIVGTNDNNLKTLEMVGSPKRVPEKEQG
jgi:hypothetical protein